MIYFITAREVRRVKIVYSATPQLRFSKVCSDSPVVLKMERVTEGERSDEKALHLRFAAYRVTGEWFNIAPPIEAYMAALLVPEAKRRRAIRDPHVESALIDAVGAKVVAQFFGLTPATLHMWRKRGIPLLKRFTFARLCRDSNIDTPSDFFEKFELAA